MDPIATWNRDGYLVLRHAVDRDTIANLRRICDGALAQWRRDSSPDVEPGGWAYGPQAWILLHLNHPVYHRGRQADLAALLQAAARPEVLALLRDLFQDEPEVAQINYYINPPEQDRANAWHRDCQFYHGPHEQDKVRALFAREMSPPRSLHMHIPLAPTAATELVPGSHRRWDTPEEEQIRRHEAQRNDMPGAVAVTLEPGDLAFFHVNTIHRGIYQHRVLRRTIAVSYSRASDPQEITPERLEHTRGYVAPYQPWFRRPGYLDGLPPAIAAYYRAYVERYGDRLDLALVDALPAARRGYFTQA